jgi:endonuclease-3
MAKKSSKSSSAKKGKAGHGRKQKAPKWVGFTGETEAQEKKRTLKIIDLLTDEYPNAKCHLDFENPFQLLISTILSAQCSDALVNRMMGPLYKDKYKGPEDFLRVPDEEVQEEIYPITFFRNKTRSVKKCCETLIEKFGGKVPESMEDLMTLGGVGRKSANAIRGNAFGYPAIITDTHAIRVSQRLGFTDNELGDKVELDLLKIIPTEKQTPYSLTIGEHGRKVCKARNPDCPVCIINHLCPSKDLFV